MTLLAFFTGEYFMLYIYFLLFGLGCLSIVKNTSLPGAFMLLFSIWLNSLTKSWIPS